MASPSPTSWPSMEATTPTQAPLCWRGLDTEPTTRHLAQKVPCMNYATPSQLDTLWRRMREHFGDAELERGWQYLCPTPEGAHYFRKRAGMPTANGGIETVNRSHVLHL
jgi:hypothetical protein